MKTTIHYNSAWIHVQSGKTCTVHSDKRAGEMVSTFTISGYNPLPCMHFRGTYLVLAKWLQANGWVRDTRCPDVIYIKDTP